MRRSKRQSAHRQATSQVDHVTLDGLATSTEVGDFLKIRRY
jgi:hypothetical protein